MGWTPRRCSDPVQRPSISGTPTPRVWPTPSSFGAQPAGCRWQANSASTGKSRQPPAARLPPDPPPRRRERFQISGIWCLVSGREVVDHRGPPPRRDAARRCFQCRGTVWILGGPSEQRVPWYQFIAAPWKRPRGITEDNMLRLRRCGLVGVLVVVVTVVSGGTALAAAGDINTIAGTGTAGFSGDGAAAVGAQLS